RCRTTFAVAPRGRAWKIAAPVGLLVLLAAATVFAPALRRDPGAGPDPRVAPGEAAPSRDAVSGRQPQPPAGGAARTNAPAAAPPPSPQQRRAPPTPAPPPAEPPEARTAPPAPKTVLPLGGGRLLHPGVPGLFAHNDHDELSQILFPPERQGDADPPRGCI